MRAVERRAAVGVSAKVGGGGWRRRSLLGRDVQPKGAVDALSLLPVRLIQPNLQPLRRRFDAVRLAVVFGRQFRGAEAEAAFVEEERGAGQGVTASAAVRDLRAPGRVIGRHRCGRRGGNDASRRVHVEVVGAVEQRPIDLGR